jgi:asparagine synthase (glutamine-hydrolysing)
MASHDGRRWVVLNGEIYNYLELRRELPEYQFTTGTDTEVLLAAFDRWGSACLERLIGMFAFITYDTQTGEVFAARDRFGVKPLFYAKLPGGGLALASEIKALHRAGLPRSPDPATWANYLGGGMTDHTPRSFWADVWQVPPGGYLVSTADGGCRIGIWYDLGAVVSTNGPDLRDDSEVEEELDALLAESLRLRLRADVPVGICLSGGLDSSLLLSLVASAGRNDLSAFTFECGVPEYDETPWVRQALAGRAHPLHIVRLDPGDVPALAGEVLAFQDEPFGGVPTLGMACVHACAKTKGVTVLLDGNGLDEAWAGYDYYQRPTERGSWRLRVQGSSFDSSATREQCLEPSFRALIEPPRNGREFSDPVTHLQYLDLRFLKIPRAMRFADRVSMMHSRELREPFLDYRLVELGLRQPLHRKIRNGAGKWLVRQLARRRLGDGLAVAPKRPVQTPQREWLRGPLAEWVSDHIEQALGGWGRDWLQPDRVRAEWQHYRDRGRDDSFLVWQWLMLGLMQARRQE